MKIYESDLTFQFWEYKVSHGGLLIRSPISKLKNVNTDIIFNSVEYISLPRYLKGVIIKAPNDDEVLRVSSILNKKIPSRNVFVIASEGVDYLIVALSMMVDINEMGLFDSPFGYKY